MSSVNIKNVTVLDNRCRFSTLPNSKSLMNARLPYKTFIRDLECKLVYVGSAEDETYDPVLESVPVDPVNVGNYCSVFQGQEFIRVQYYVNNNYDDEQLREEPPQKVLIDKIKEILWPISIG